MLNPISDGGKPILLFLTGLIDAMIGAGILPADHGWRNGDCRTLIPIWNTKPAPIESSRCWLHSFAHRG